jgi:hypothetical protein
VSATRSGPLTTGPGVKPGETPPTLNAYSLLHTMTGAQNFAVYYFKALDWSFATTDPYLLEQVSAPTCSACQKYIESISALDAAGGHLQGGRVQVSGFSMSVGNLVPAEYVIDMTLIQDPGVAIRPSTNPSPVASGGAAIKVTLYLSWVSLHWQTAAIG